MPKVIKSAGRDIILKVKRACEEERDNNGPVVPFSKVRARVAYLTGVSERTITQITRESNVAAASSSKIVTPGKKRNRVKKIEELDGFDKCAIRHKIQSFYNVKKEIPTINKLWLELKADIDCKYGRTSLRSILSTMGYKYKKCQSKRKVLIERSDIAAWRAKYVLRLRKNRQENRPVVYLDETYIHASYHLQKCWQSEEQPGIFSSDSVGARWIIAHAGGKTGFVENGLLLFKSKSKSSDYHDDMNSVNFIRWMNEKIVPNLPSNCIVVMDNASYHCTQINKAPTMGNTKAELQEWLRNNNFYIEDCWTKPQLYELIKRHKGDPQYEVEQLLNEHGHELLRLPAYHCDLNPIEQIWAIVKRRIAEKNVNQASDEIASITEAAFKTVTTEEWVNVCHHVEKIEDKYFESDKLLDVEMDKFIINITGDTSESSDTEDSRIDSDDGMEGIIPLQDHCYFKKIIDSDDGMEGIDPLQDHCYFKKIT